MLEQASVRLATVAFCGNCPWSAHGGPTTSAYAHQHAQIRQHAVRIVSTDAIDLVPATAMERR